MSRSKGHRGWALVSMLIALAAPGLSAGAETPPPPAAPAQAQPPKATKPSPLRAVLLYLPNRVMDILDVFTLGVGVPSPQHVFPAGIHANIHATRAAQAGIGATHGLFLGKDFRRRLSWGVVHDEISFGPFTVTSFERFQHPGGESAKVERAGVLLPSDEPFAKGLADYWAVGANAGLIVVAAQAEVHPVEILDAILGFFFIDISGDDH